MASKLMIDWLVTRRALAKSTTVWLAKLNSSRAPVENSLPTPTLPAKLQPVRRPVAGLAAGGLADGLAGGEELRGEGKALQRHRQGRRVQILAAVLEVAAVEHGQLDRLLQLDDERLRPRRTPVGRPRSRRPAGRLVGAGRGLVLVAFGRGGAGPRLVLVAGGARGPVGRGGAVLARRASSACEPPRSADAPGSLLASDNPGSAQEKTKARGSGGSPTSGRSFSISARLAASHWARSAR